MEMMTSRWTDDRMDDLKHQADELGRRMETGFAEQRSEMNARFDRLEKSLEVRFEKVDERFDKVDERFERVDAKFERIDAKFDVVTSRSLARRRR
jgi:predicted  nucleic acid-binding Zn-ribbon protein